MSEGGRVAGATGRGTAWRLRVRVRVAQVGGRSQVSHSTRKSVVLTEFEVKLKMKTGRIGTGLRARAPASMPGGRERARSWACCPREP